MAYTTPTKALILRDLEFGPATYVDLMEVLRLTICTVRRALDSLHAERKIHICKWERRPIGLPVRVYALGEGIDKRRPSPLPKKITNLRFRKKRMEKCWIPEVRA